MPPDEVSASQTGPNGERLQIQLGTRSFGLQAKDIVSVLLLLGGIVGGYLLWVATDHRLATLETQQGHVFEALTAQTTTLLDAVHGQRAFMTDKLTEQRLFVLDKLQDNREATASEMKDLRRILSIVQWNLGHRPEEHLPFEMDHPPPETPVPR